MPIPYNSTIIAIDPAQSTGVALARATDGGRSAEIYDYFYLDVDSSSEYMGDWCNNLASTIEDIINRCAPGPKYVVIEDFFFSSRFVSGCDVNPAFRTAIHMQLRKMGLDYTILNISQWKSFIAGRSVPTKEQKKKWGKTQANKLFIQQALFERYNIKFPNHSLSEKTGKPIKFRYDIVDAVAQLICFSKLHLNIDKVTCSVAIPEDVEFKKPPKDMFVYSVTP